MSTAKHDRVDAVIHPLRALGNAYCRLIIICSLCFAGNAFGEMVSFSAFTNGYWQIWAIDTETRQLDQLTKSPKDKKEASWLPDGSGFIYRTSNAKFFCLDLKAGTESPFLASYGNVFDPAVSPDGRQIGFTRFRPDGTDESDIWIFDNISRDVIRLTNVPKLQYDPTWSPNGETLAYVSSERNGHHIFSMDMHRRKPFQLTKDGDYNIAPVWSAKGTHIAFSSNRTGDYEIWVCKSEGGEDRRLTRSKGLDGQPVWSADASKLYFVSNRLGDMQLWGMKRDGSDQRLLTPSHMRCSDPRLAP